MREYGTDRIDFRSDTVTQPTSAMREAMNQARVGDDVLGVGFTAIYNFDVLDEMTIIC